MENRDIKEHYIPKEAGANSRDNPGPKQAPLARRRGGAGLGGWIGGPGAWRVLRAITERPPPPNLDPSSSRTGFFYQRDSTWARVFFLARLGLECSG
jgi:hypothetical protein